jgi:hypothetical protein
MLNMFGIIERGPLYIGLERQALSLLLYAPLIHLRVYVYRVECCCRADCCTCQFRYINVAAAMFDRCNLMIFTYM